jgi:hypothetical protein
MLLLLVPISFKLSILHEPLASKTCKRNYKSWILSCYIAKVCVSHAYRKIQIQMKRAFCLDKGLNVSLPNIEIPHENSLVREKLKQSSGNKKFRLKY